MNSSLDLSDRVSEMVVTPQTAVPEARENKEQKKYESTEEFRVLGVNSSYAGYPETHSLASNFSRTSLATTTVTFVSGAMISPQIRIFHEVTTESPHGATAHPPHKIPHARVTIPISAVDGLPTHRALSHPQDSPLTDDGFRGLILTVPVNLDRAVLSICEVPADDERRRLAEAWSERLSTAGTADVNLIFQSCDRPLITLDFLDMFGREYHTAKSRVVDAGLHCILYEPERDIRNIDWSRLNLHLDVTLRYSIPSTMVFHNERSRVIRLQAAALEDYKQENVKALKLEKSVHRCTLLPDFSSA
ncbi:hypothetical protein CCHL11_00766 [Colletotrichum chlorophyti]|uniref:Uncharacterized protein n=1 Tax=Colletotrichum chlorophyti TaxID=708187 RepID=A0A1Q8S5G5_9PEZI|nr:hypothetical protein CCHL11_00766 [Colletotrichum chlorophyti]